MGPILPALGSTAPMQQISNYWGLVSEYTAIKDSCSKSSLFDDNDDDDDEEDKDDYNNYNYAIYINKKLFY